MSSDIAGEDEKLFAEHAAFVREQSAIVESYYRLSPEEFAELTAKKQNLILFEMLREQSGSVRDLARMGQELEEYARMLREKVEEYSTPEGLNKLIKMVTDNLGGGLFGGLGKMGF